MSPAPKKETTETILKWIGAFVAVGGLLWGITSFIITARIEAETRQLEARKPFLERQLTLYTDATKSAATLATSTDAKTIQAAQDRFWELYWGELAMVENSSVGAKDSGVEAAMIAFGSCLKRNCTQSELQPLALSLAHACRNSLAVSWGVEDWALLPNNK